MLFSLWLNLTKRVVFFFNVLKFNATKTNIIFEIVKNERGINNTKTKSNISFLLRGVFSHRTSRRQKTSVDDDDADTLIPMNIQYLCTYT